VLITDCKSDKAAFGVRRLEFMYATNSLFSSGASVAAKAFTAANLQLAFFLVEVASLEGISPLSIELAHQGFEARH